MKRTILLLAILAVFSITSVSQVYALPIAGERAVTVSSWLSYYFAHLMRVNRRNLGYEERLIDDDGNDAMLRGDADDYANGKNEEIIPNPKYDPMDQWESGLGLSDGSPIGSGGI